MARRTETAAMAGAIMALLLVIPWPAWTQMPHHPACGPNAEIVEQLIRKYREQPVAFGVQSNGKLLQIYASEDGASWTAVTLDPSGRACIVAVGKNLEFSRGRFDDPA